MKPINEFIKKNQLTVIAIAITFFVHFPYINSGFVWVDHNDIEEKKAVVSLSEIPHAFFLPFGETSFYRPVVVVANSIDYAIYNTWSPGYHITNLILHIFVVVIAGYFLRAYISLSKEQTFLTQVFIGVHPMSILIVGAITRRQETIASIFIMLSVVIYTYARKYRETKYIIISSILFFLALCTKETSLGVVPTLIFLWEFTRRKESLSKSLGLWISQVCALVLYFILRTIAVPQVWNMESSPMIFGNYLATRIALAGKWLWYGISPLKPIFSDAVSVHMIADRKVLSLLVFFICILVFVVKRGYKSDIGKMLIMIGIFLIPGLALIPVPRIGTPNYGYLPVIPISGIIAIGWCKLQNSNRSLATGLIVIWILIASISTFITGEHFKNDFTLFKPEVENTYFPEGHYYLGNYYLKVQDYKNAKREFEKALEKRNDMIAYSYDYPVLINLAGVNMQLNDNESAEKFYIKAFENAPDSQKEFILFNIALAAYNRQDYAKAQEILETRSWSIPQAYLMLSEIKKANSL